MSNPDEAGLIGIQFSKPYGVRGGSVNITALSEQSTVIIKIFNPSGTNIYEQVWNSNTTRTIPINASAPYGDYKVELWEDIRYVDRFFTVVDITGWESVTTFPYTFTWRGIDHTFNNDWTVKFNEEMTLDFSTLRDIVQLHNCTVTATKNSNAFRLRIEKASIGLTVDLVFFFIYAGTKFVVSGTMEEARTINFTIPNIENFRQLAGDRLKNKNIIFDWSDVRKAGQAFSYSNGVLSVDVPQTFEIDPNVYGTNSTFDTASSGTPSWMKYRGMGYQNGRWWNVYRDGTNILYTSSVGGRTDADWASPTTIVAGASAQINATYDGKYVHIVYWQGGSGYGIWYRRGLTDSTGTITWTDAVKAVPDAASQQYYYPQCDVDSKGHVLIGYSYGASGSNTPYVTKNANTDGTWTTATNFPYQLNTTAGVSYWLVNVVALLNDEILCSYGGNASGELRLKRCNEDGSTWQTEVASGNTLYQYYDHGLVAHGLDNNADVVFSITGYTYHRAYTYDTNALESATTLTASSTYCDLAIDKRTDNLYSTSHSATIYIRRYNRSTTTWDSIYTMMTSSGYYSAGYISLAKRADWGVGLWFTLATTFDCDVCLGRWYEGFESGDFTFWTGTSSSGTLYTFEVLAGAAYLGSYGLHTQSISNTDYKYCYKTFAQASPTAIARFYLTILTAPSATIEICWFSSATGNISLLRVTSGMILQIVTRTGGTSTLTSYGSSTTTLVAGQRYLIEFYHYTNSSTGGVYLKINDVLETSITGHNNTVYGDADRFRAFVYYPYSGSGTISMYIDNVAIDGLVAIGPTVHWSRKINTRLAPTKISSALNYLKANTVGTG